MTRLYRALLLLLPGPFRREFGSEMARVVEEHWDEVRRERSRAGGARFWMRQVAALLGAAVKLRLGGPEGPGAVRTEHGTQRDDGRAGMMDGLGQDLRHSARSLRRNPGFTVVTVLTLGLGIGASTVVFSAVRAVLLRDLPYGDADRVVTVFHENRDTGERANGVSAANVRDLRENADGLAEVAVAEPWSMDLQVEGRAESLRAWAVTEGFFRAAGVDAVRGRTFLPEEYALGAEPVVLLSHGSWRTRFGGDPSLVGERITLDGQAVTVVGVLPEAFRLPETAELWLPRPFQEWDDRGRTADYMTGIARLAPGVTHAQAQAEASRVAASLGEKYPDTNARLDLRLIPLREHLFGDVRGPLLVLFGAVGFVLLIACVNVTGLMLARGAERTREYALRGALGASVGRLARHVTVESLVLAAAGCLLGLGIAHLGIGLLQGLGPDHLPRIDEIEVDGAVLAFAMAVAGLSAFVSGVVPSLRLARPDLTGALGEGGRGTSGSRRGASLRHRLVVLEVAAAMVLLVGAGLLFKSFSVLLDRELGFEPEGRLAVQVFAYDYEDGAARAAFVRQALDEMEALPGVGRVALASTIPTANDEGALSSIDIDLTFTVEERAAPPPGQEPTVRIDMVSAGYFETLEIPVVEGRGFTLADDGQAPPVVVVTSR